MTVTRAHIIFFFSVIIMAVGVYLTNKGNGQGPEGQQNRKLGKILTWSGAAILLVTMALAYKIVQR